MNFTQELAYCEKIIAPYKEQLSDNALYDIYTYVVEYWRVDAGIVYTDEELEEIEDRQKYELFDIIYGIMYRDGIPVYDNDETDDV